MFRNDLVLVTVVTVLIISILFISELRAYLQVKRQDTLSVDLKAAGKMNIFFNITFPHVKCNGIHCVFG